MSRIQCKDKQISHQIVNGGNVWRWAGALWSMVVILQEGDMYSYSRCGTSFLARPIAGIPLFIFVFGSCKSRTPVTVRSHRSENIKVSHTDWHLEIRSVDECLQFFLIVCRQIVNERCFQRWRSWRSIFRGARTTRQSARQGHLVARWKEVRL